MSGKKQVETALARVLALVQNATKSTVLTSEKNIMSGKRTSGETSKMNKYPLDYQGIADLTRDIVQSAQATGEIITRLSDLLDQALQDSDGGVDGGWQDEAEELLAALKKREADFDLHRFNQTNGHNVRQVSPYPDTRPMDPFQEGKLSAQESSFGEEMSEEDLAKHFREPAPKKKKKREKEISKMTLREIEAWEKAQDNSNDIYKVSARIKNLARQGAGANLTPAGDVLCNSYTHVIKSFYDFADKIEDADTKIKLIEKIKSNEGMVSQVISALGAGVTVKKGM